MRRILDAAGDRPLTKSQDADFGVAITDFGAALKSSGDIDLARSAGKVLQRATDTNDAELIVGDLEAWARENPNGGRKSAGRMAVDDGPIGTSWGPSTRPSYKAKLDWGGEFAAARSTGTKALLDPGTVEVSVPLATDPVTDARQARFVYELVPAADAPGSHFAYLRQTARTNNAAVVATGLLKPQSVYTLERVDDRTKVIAHVTEPFDRFLFEDAPMLQAFLNGELLYGLNKALDSRVVTTIRAAATAGSATLNLANLRTAITTLQSADLEPTGIVLSPTDWQAIEAAAATQFASNDGQTTATDAMERRLYGIPVAVSNSTPNGKALVGDFRGSARIYRTGTASITVHDSHPRTVDATDTADFRLNQVMFRAEMRGEVAVIRSAGFIRVGPA